MQNNPKFEKIRRQIFINYNTLVISMGEVLEIIGLDNFNEEEQTKLKSEISALSQKLKTHSHTEGISKIKVFIKEYREKNKTYSIKLDVIFTSRKFEADSADWSITTALKKAFEKINEEMEHEFHNKGHQKH